MLTMLRLSILQVVILSVAAILASTNFGCTTSHLTDVWRDPAFGNSPMTNMLIIAAKNSPVTRRLWEDEIVGGLSAQGVASTPSYRIFPDSIPDPAQVGAIVQENKFDGVLFTRKLPTQISTTVIPGSVKNEQVTRYDPRTQTYSTFYRDVQQEGYVDTSKIVRHEVSVFAPQGEGGRLVWDGTGEMISPTSREAIRHEITSLVIPELLRQGIVAKK